MTLKEQKDAKIKELKALEAKIKAGDAEAIKAGEVLADAITELNTAIAASQKSMDILNSIGSDDSTAGDDSNVNPSPQKSRSLGEHFVKSMKTDEKSGHFTVSAPSFKASTDVQTVPAGAQGFFTTYDKNIVTSPRTEINVRDLFGSEQISGNALTYLVEGALEGTVGKTVEGTKKPQVHFADPIAKTVSLEKIAAFIKESDEYRNDAAFLQSVIDGRLLYELNLSEQKSLVTQLLATSGIQTGTADFKSAIAIADAIRLAKNNVKKMSGFVADTVLINPDLNYILDTGKDANGQYYGGGYFGSPAAQPVWGMNVVESDEVTGIVVGAFKACGSVVSNGEGQRIEMTNSDGDDFTNNLMTIRAEERMTLAVRRPSGFYNLTAKV